MDLEMFFTILIPLADAFAQAERHPEPTCTASSAAPGIGPGSPWRCWSRIHHNCL